MKTLSGSNINKIIHVALIILLLLCCDIGSAQQKPQYFNFKELPLLDFTISDSDLLLIEIAKQRAEKSGVIESDSKQWMEILLIDSLGSYSAKARIKGDWLDHIENDKFSLRIKIIDTLKTFNESKIFSIQQPKTRGYLREWLLHKILENENILTTKYDFVWVKQNEKSKGIYAFEQHFDNYLLARQGRNEAPILKFDENGFWEVIQLKLKSKDSYVQDYYSLDVASITAFGKNSVFNNENLKSQFYRTADIINQFRFLDTTAIKYFDKTKYAQFFALTDVFENYHSLNWINLRFYQNPITWKIEPVVYDGYTDKEPVKWNSTPIMGYVDEEHDTIYNMPQALFAQFFSDVEFQKNYYNYLRKYSSDEFLDQVFKKFNSELIFLENQLSKEFIDYKFNKSNYYKRAQEVRNTIENDKMNLINEINTFTYYSLWSWLEDVKNKQKKPDLIDTLLITEFGLKAQYFNDTLYLINNNPKFISILSYTSALNEEIKIEPYQIEKYNPKAGPQVIKVAIPYIKQINYSFNGKNYKSDIYTEGRLSFWKDLKD